nr:hypothetical protein CFP56_17659 [Quercus suber]
MKAESKIASKTHTYSNGINSSNFKLKKMASCFDFTKLSEALNVAQEKGTVGEVVDNINDATSSSSSSANSTYDFSKLLEVVHGIQEKKKSNHQTNRGTTNRDWQLTLILAGYINRKTKRRRYAYEAKDIAGTIIYVGCGSSGARTLLMAIQEALAEALSKAKDLGYQSIIVLTANRTMEQVCNGSNDMRKPQRQEQAIIANLHLLRQQGVTCYIKVVPKIILSSQIVNALIASKKPVRHC